MTETESIKWHLLGVHGLSFNDLERIGFRETVAEARDAHERHHYFNGWLKHALADGAFQKGGE